MRKDAKEYMDSVVSVIVRKYNLPEAKSYELVKNSFLYDSLEHYPGETLHDDIETNADLVYSDFVS